MSHQRHFINAISDILLVGDWQSQAMLQRVYWLLQSEPVWVISLVNRIVEKFQADFPNITKREIAEFIVHDQKFLGIWTQQRHQMHIRHYNLEQIPPPSAKLQCDIPRLQNFRKLANWLGLNFAQLENYASNWRITSQPAQTRLRHYHYHWTQKRQGQLRLIEAPKQRMVAVQRQIYLGILDHIPLHKACHGFRKKHWCLSYVEPHAGRSVVIHMDLEDFFITTPFRRIHALFTTIGYHDSVARRLAGLCCNQTPLDILDENPQLSWQQRKQLMAPHLPQGSPSSPGLANLCAYKLDVRLAALAKKLGGTYTRYADDRVPRAQSIA